MAITESVGRLGATLIAMVQTRLELAAVELEEESQRWLSYVLMALLALFLFGIAVILLALFVIIFFWDTYRLAAVLGMAALFGIGGALVVGKLRAGFNSKPRLLAATLAELNKDVNCVRNADESHEY